MARLNIRNNTVWLQDAGNHSAVTLPTSPKDKGVLKAAATGQKQVNHIHNLFSHESPDACITGCGGAMGGPSRVGARAGENVRTTS